MTQAELQELLWEAVGVPAPIAAREVLSSGGTSLRYEWVKSWRGLHAALEAGLIDLSDGEEWVAFVLTQVREHR